MAARGYPSRKKKRRRQRDQIDDELESLIAIYLAADDDDEPPAAAGITPEDMARAERRRLIQPENLHLFVAWHTMGGPMRPPSPMELRDWPAAMVKDFRMLTARLAEIKRKMDR